MATQHSSPKVSSEDILSQKTDLCISNAIVKTGLGFSAGVVLSVLLFKRRAFPVWLGTGFGLGSGYTDCDRSFNPVAVPGVRVVPAGATEIGTGPATTFEKLQQKAGEAFGSAREKVQDKASEITSAIQEKGKEAFEKAKAAEQKVEDKVRRV
ncbi:DUF543-domain-containing protein [Violaceomyces palustris]|uniref:DUF543-domain-containing protein n=1 Tax=Violaceomyces palustris TaxID=1673888 RepID=A0ACD0NVY0_9BASI|nr:DUF543-domain-containing protein [Violaceomyces palustris]